VAGGNQSGQSTRAEAVGQYASSLGVADAVHRLGLHRVGGAERLDGVAGLLDRGDDEVVELADLREGLLDGLRAGQADQSGVSGCRKLVSAG
jgi:hypothetical protein